MEIKGTAVRTTPDYVRNRYPGKYNSWLNRLPAYSHEIISKPVQATEWYPLSESVIIPTHRLANELKKSPEEVARELGRYSAEVALKGVYKVFIMIASPHFMLKRASNIFSAYYNPGDLKVIDSSDNAAVLRFLHFSKEHKLIAYRIAGWLEKALELTKQKDIEIKVKLFENQSNYIQLHIGWGGQAKKQTSSSSSYSTLEELIG